MDVYSRSSGAAWSMAARRYFRKGDADLPSRGSFVYRGTQVVTGAEARQVKEDQARRRSAADDLLRPRPGTKPAPRQAFDHAPERQDRSTRRPPARPAQSPPASTPDEAPDRGAATGYSADPDLTPQPGTALRAAAAATPGDADAVRQPVAAEAARTTAAPYRRAAAARTSQPAPGNSMASRDASMGASAVIGAVAALLVTTPIVLVGGAVLWRPIDPFLVAVVILLAALSGAIAAAAWEAGRRRNEPR